MAALMTVISSVIVGIVTAEIIAYAPRIACWLIHRSVLRLPEAERERFREEWLAHANELPGSLAKILHGLGCVCKGARRIANQRREGAKVDEMARDWACTILRGFIWVRLAPLTVPHSRP